MFFKNIKNVHAFEPNKENYKHLQKNIEINNANIVTHNIACSEYSTHKIIWYTDKNKMGGSSIYNKNDPELLKYKKEDIKFEKIDAKKLDDIIDIKNNNVLIKIDVERHEIDVLKGACEKILKNNNVIMQIEIQEDLKNRVFNFLEKNNFKLINSIRHDYYFKNYPKN